MYICIMKQCIKCKISKDLPSFSKDAATKCGYRPRCKDCEATIRKQSRIGRGQKVAANRRYDVVGYKTCSECRLQKAHSDFNKSNITKDNLLGKCKACSRLYSHNNYHNNHKIRAAILCNVYKKIDTKKGLPNNLTVDYIYNNIIFKACHYCGEKEDKIGCDRVDNSKSHNCDNVVPCCYLCNATRSNRFTEEEMLEIGKIIKNIKYKRKINAN